MRSDQSLLAQEQTDNKRLFPVGEDVETIIVQLEIMKVSDIRKYSWYSLFRLLPQQLPFFVCLFVCLFFDSVHCVCARC